MGTTTHKLFSGDLSDAGRSLSLLDPTYASKYIPIIASVSEHQPPAWPSYFTDLHVASVLMPAGLIALFWPLTAASMFLILYACTAVYFSGVMVRAPSAPPPSAADPHALLTKVQSLLTFLESGRACLTIHLLLSRMLHSPSQSRR